MEFALPTLKWANQNTRVEHLVVPKGWLTAPGKHLRSCDCRCWMVQLCPECGKPSTPVSISGRWDEVNGYTARPFDAVWVRLLCGCEFGDKSLAEPPEEPQ